MTLAELLQSWEDAPGFVAWRHISRQEIQAEPPIYLDKYLLFTGHTPPNRVGGENTDVLITMPNTPDEIAQVVSWT